MLLVVDWMTWFLCVAAVLQLQVFPARGGFSGSADRDGGGDGRVDTGEGGGEEEGGAHEGGILDLPILSHLYRCFV